MENDKSFKDLDAWKEGINLVNMIYEVTKKFPKEELYFLTTQIRKAAISIPSNIAEGLVRYHKKTYCNFYL